MRTNLQEYEVVVPSIDIPDHDLALKKGDRVHIRGKSEIILADGREIRQIGAQGMVVRGWLRPYVPPEKRKHETPLALLENAIRE